MSASLPSVSGPMTSDELVQHALRCLAAIADLPQLQQLAALKAAAGIAEAAVDHQTRLYVLGSILTKR